MLVSTDLLRPFEEMTQLLDRMLAAPFFRDGTRLGPGPGANLYEQDTGYVVEVAAPGLNPETLEVAVEGGVLTVSGERPAPAGVDPDRYARTEREHGRFVRRIRLPDHVDREKIEAEYRHGVLYVTLPKLESARPRKIAVKVQ